MITVRQVVRRGSVAASMVVCLLVCLGPAEPSPAMPWWHVSTISAPAKPADGKGKIVVEVSNLGDAMIRGTEKPVTIEDKLPTGVTATAIYGEGGGGEIGSNFAGFFMNCSVATLSCTYRWSTISVRTLDDRD